MGSPIDRIAKPVLERIDPVLGAAGYAALVYGSAARDEYREGVSDLNLLLVARELSPRTLQRLSEALADLREKRQPPPLLMEREEWAAATDVFPIEVTDMQSAHLLLRGEDPLRGLRVDRADLRRALESEFRAKLLRLRQAYALFGADPAQLGLVARGTVASVAALFRVSLALYGHTVPANTVAALTGARTAMDIDTAPVASLWSRRSPDGPPCEPALFEGYLAAVSAAVRVIDSFSRGGQ